MRIFGRGHYLFLRLKVIFLPVYFLTIVFSPAISLAGEDDIQNALNKEFDKASVAEEKETTFSRPATEYEAAQSEIPAIVLTGLRAYQLEGAEAAIREWIKGGPAEHDPNALKSAETFREIEKFYGKYSGYRLIHTKDLTSNSKLIYLQMNYQKGPLFGRFLCYRTGSTWIISGRFVFDTDPQQVLPSDVLAA